MIPHGNLLLQDQLTPKGESLLFAQPVEVLEAFTPADALAALDRIEAAKATGFWVAGYMAYELGFLFEDRLRKFLPERSDKRLLWLGLYKGPERLSASTAVTYLEAKTAGLTGRVCNLTLDMDAAHYQRAFNTIKEHIAAGDAYQVNLTFKANFNLEGDAAALYRDLVRKQPVAHSALLQTGDETILSLSPELFVENRNGTLSTRPMKGTRARGRTLAEDDEGRATLAADEKNRAENLMIVDLLRNDLSRISKIGSVAVTDLFTIETYRSLHQMTSGITARLNPDVTTLQAIRNLFPCGSITGAPKIRAMEIIHAVENGPRGLYTGSIGYIAPTGDFRFNVAIRTAVIDKDGNGEVGIGGGIVSDSDCAAEYEEAKLKLKVFAEPYEPLALIETLLWKQEKGFWLQDRHIERLLTSARYFGIAIDEASVRSFLNEQSQLFTAPRIRARLLLDERGGLSLTATPLGEAKPQAPFRFVIAEQRANSASPWLYHKTTNRKFYDAARNANLEKLNVDEVVFLNERGELTEGSITSLFIERNGKLLTPQLHAGLLPGILRAELLATGRAQEAVLTMADLKSATNVYLGNSVRGLMTALFVQAE